MTPSKFSLCLLLSTNHHHVGHTALCIVPSRTHRCCEGEQHAHYAGRDSGEQLSNGPLHGLTHARLQELVQSAIADLRTLQSRIIALSVFSDNESLEDISTADLVYLLVPYVLAEVEGRVRTVDPEERLERAAHSRVSRIVEMSVT